MVKPARIFTFYAKVDEPFVEQLTARLSLLRRKGIVNDYHDKAISPTEIWDQHSRSIFRSSDYLLFLVSPAFLESGYFEDSDIKKAVSLAEEGNINIIPVLIHECNFSEEPLAKFRTIPLNDRPVDSPLWGSEENAWKAVTDGLKELITGEKPEVPMSDFTTNDFEQTAPASKRGMSLAMQLLISIVVLASMAGITYYLVNDQPAKADELAVHSTNFPDSSTIAPVATDTVPTSAVPVVEKREEKKIPPVIEAPRATRTKRPPAKPANDTIRKEIKDTVEKKEPPPPPLKAPTIKSAELEKMLFDFSQGKGTESDFAPYLCNKLETTVRFEKKSMSFHEMCVAIKDVKAKKIKKISVVAASYEGSCISNLEVDMKRKLF